MKYRNMLKNQEGTHDVVWFGSVGLIRPEYFCVEYSVDVNGTIRTNNTGNVYMYDIPNNQGRADMIITWAGTTRIDVVINTGPIINGVCDVAISFGSFTVMDPTIVNLEKLTINYVGAL